MSGQDIPSNPSEPQGSSYTPPAAPSPPPAPPQVEGTPGLATASLVLGIVSLPTCICYGCPSLICGALAIIFGGMILSQIKQGEAPESARGLAVAGLSCGIGGVVLSGVYWILQVVGVGAMLMMENM